MDYNTQREKMPFGDYGRNVYNLIKYAKRIPDRDKRTRAAEVIINIMAQVNPVSRETVDYRRHLWDHLMILSNWELDVDCPYELTRTESVIFHPNRVPYGNHKMRYRHYGHCLESMIDKVSTYPEGEEKELLLALIVAQMKKSFITWNRSIGDGYVRDFDQDDIIQTQLQAISNGRLQVGSFQLPIDKKAIPSGEQFNKGGAYKNKNKNNNKRKYKRH